MKASVIISSYNSKERLYYNLISLNNQDCNFDIYEVVVVDNGSNDDTIEMLKKFKPKFNFIFTRLEKNKGIARGRNEAIKNASGDILIFHDSDMIAPKDFISRHLEHHKEKNIVVCGIPWKRIVTFYYRGLEYQLEKTNLDGIARKIKEKCDISDKFPLIDLASIIDGSYIKYSYDLDTDFIKVLKQILKENKGSLDGYQLPWRLFITNNASVERRRAIDVGLFDENIIRYGFEDYDLGIRLYKSGSKFVFDNDILNVHQEHPTNISIEAAYENTNYICDKYNNIYFLDVILVCVSYLTSIDGSKFNELVKDINNMLPLNCFQNLLNIFLELLQTFRRRALGRNISNNNKKIPEIDIDLNKTLMEVIQLRDVFGIKYFTEAMLSLIRDVYNV